MDSKSLLRIKKFIFVFVQSSLECGIVSWSSASNTYLEPLATIQKLTLKIIVKVLFITQQVAVHARRQARLSLKI